MIAAAAGQSQLGFSFRAVQFEIPANGPGLFTGMLLGYQNINRRDNQQSKHGSNRHACNQRYADGIPGGSAGASD